jgi:hypothetical protein
LELSTSRFLSTVPENAGVVFHAWDFDADGIAAELVVSLRHVRPGPEAIPRRSTVPPAAFAPERQRLFQTAASWALLHAKTSFPVGGENDGLMG